MTAQRNYETTYILTPETDEAERLSIKERVKAIIEEQFGGSIAKVDDWGRRELAYDIKKQNFGYYVHTRHTSPAECIRELERILRLTDPVIKFLTVRLHDAAVASADSVVLIAPVDAVDAPVAAVDAAVDAVDAVEAADAVAPE